jgi:hypothetical protein
MPLADRVGEASRPALSGGFPVRTDDSFKSLLEVFIPFSAVFRKSRDGGGDSLDAFGDREEYR